MRRTLVKHTGRLSPKSPALLPAHPSASSKSYLQSASASTAAAQTSDKSSPRSRPISGPETKRLDRTLERLLQGADEGPRDPTWSYTPDRGKRDDEILIKAAASGGRASSTNIKRKSKETGELDYDHLELSTDSSRIGDIRAGHYIMCQRYVSRSNLASLNPS